LARRAKAKWGLTDEAAKELSRIKLEPDYGRHSRRALEKLVPLMREGMAYATARKAAYPESFKANDPLHELPPVRDWNKDLKSPAVLRALTELRKVVNALIRKHGKPARVHIELARDLKNSRDRRKKLWQDNQDRQKRRKNAVREMLDKFPGRTASQRDIDKWLLATECAWVCPYTGKSISAETLISDHPQFDIEHILPRKYLDDSFANKTLCHVDFNRLVKRDRLPSQALGSDPKAWGEALQRVAAFIGPEGVVEGKRRRFEMLEVPDEFVARQLNDTRYNSRLAADYLSVLFGGRSDLGQMQRVITPTGALTGLLRRVWGLNSILGDDEKNREDHRHHAIDAVVIGTIDQGLIQTAGDAAHNQFLAGSNRFLKEVDLPWVKFVDDAKRSIHAIHVSHRTTHTLAGPLHAETNYSREIAGADGGKEFHVRKELHKLTDKEILSDKIVDPAVRAAVQAKFAELTAARKNAKPNMLWGDVSKRDDYPHLIAKKDGRKIPILKVRLRTDAKPRAIGNGVRERRVASGQDSNFASMIYAVLDKDGKEIKWEHEIVTRLEAHERFAANHKKPGEKVLLPKETETRRFKFSLMKNDCLLLKGPDKEDVLYRVQKLSQNEIQLCEDYRSTISTDQRTPWNRISSIDSLRKRNAKKAAVSLIGATLPRSQKAPLLRPK
jgi:CRISPR-associated endonuclease Csn1